MKPRSRVDEGVRSDLAEVLRFSALLPDEAKGASGDRPDLPQVPGPTAPDPRFRWNRQGHEARRPARPVDERGTAIPGKPTFRCDRCGNPMLDVHCKLT